MEELIIELTNLLDNIQERTDLMWDEPDEDGNILFNGNIMNQLDTDGNPTENAILMDKIETLACNLLITDNGQPNYSNIGIMRAHGYRVYAGERDSFGWLTGCIQRGNGPIWVFG